MSAIETLLAVLIFFWIICMSCSFPLDSNNMEQDQSNDTGAQGKRYCGNTLDTTLRLACDGRFYDEHNELLRRKKRGIVDDCCKSPCTHSVLLMYCEEIKKNQASQSTTTPSTDRGSLQMKPIYSRNNKKQNGINSIDSNKIDKIREEITPRTTFQVGTIPPDEFGGRPVILLNQLRIPKSKHST